ncbi:MAG: tetratricopeptide repeat protein [Polyangiaceae bacterium]
MSSSHDESGAPPNDADASAAAPNTTTVPAMSTEAPSFADAPASSAASPAQSNPPPPAAPPPPPPTFGERARSFALAAFARARAYFDQEPTFWIAAAPLLLLSAILFTRLPNTNYIFDEQEALLANPYVNRTQGLTFLDAIHRDFWGLPADRSVGSYRPIPNFLWRLLWHVSKQPFVHHFYNVLFHALVGALVTVFAYKLSRRKDLAYLSGFLFVGCAVLTEAVSGIVGIADVFGGMGALCALLSLTLPGWLMPFGVFASLLFALFSKESGLVCVPLVPFAALLSAPLTHPKRPARVLRTIGSLVAAAAAFVIYVELRKRWFQSPLPAELQAELPADASRAKVLMHDFLVWFHQAPLPKDPLNNPLAEVEPKLRIGGALRVYERGIGQILFPKTLSGDYSFPQEPAPKTLWFPESVLGAALTVLPLLAGAAFWILAMVRERSARIAARAAGAIDSARDAVTDLDARKRWMRYAGLGLLVISVGAFALDAFVLGSKTEGLAWNFPIPFWISRSGNGAFWHAVPWPFAFLPLGLVGVGLLADGLPNLVRPEPKDEPIPLGRSGLILAGIGLVWMVVSYFPHSNIPVVLPTVRAERFWYFPALGTAPVIAVAFVWAHDVLKKRPQHAWTVPAIFAAFFGFQCIQAYRHAMDYRNDLVFWEATRDAVPNSAKAHLNYSVMKGARGDLETRLVESKRAMELAPEWPMAHIYTGDTLCRLHRAEEAWPYYKEGFAIGPNEQSLISLALQCMYDEKSLYPHEKELRDLAEAHPGSWIAYLAVDTLDNSEKHNGVDPKYRPRGYNEGPKE